MDRATRSEGLGRAPFHGVFHTIISIIILGLSAYLFSRFHHNFDPLAHVYLYDLIVSVLAVAGGILICLPLIGRPIVLGIALLLPILYMVGFGWTEYQHHRYQQYMDHNDVAIALLVFLGIAAFLGIIAFIAEISMFRRRATTGKAVV